LTRFLVSLSPGLMVVLTLMNILHFVLVKINILPRFLADKSASIVGLVV
jgi:hypothetical protein